MSTEVEYIDATEAAERLDTSRATIRRTAKSIGVGIHVRNRLVALTAKDVERIKKNMHGRPGNPEWIAAAKTIRKRKS